MEGEDYVVLKMSQNEVGAAGSMLWEGGHPCLPPPTHVSMLPPCLESRHQNASLNCLSQVPVRAFIGTVVVGKMG